MNITLYRNESATNKLFKTLIRRYTLQGTIRSTTSITDPVIEIEVPVTYKKVVDNSNNAVIDDESTFVTSIGVVSPDVNYMYIAEFDRYYFIVNIESVNNRLWNIHAHVDVLTTYQLNIRLHSALVNRNQFLHDHRQVDPRRSFEEHTEEIIISSNDFYDNTLFKENPFTLDDGNSNVYRYVFSGYIPTTETTTYDLYKRSFTCNNKFLLYKSNVISLINSLNTSATSSFLNALSNIFANNPMEGVMSLMAYPFDLERHWGLQSSTKKVLKIGNYETPTTGYDVGGKTDSDYKFPIAAFYMPTVNEHGESNFDHDLSHLTPRAESDRIGYNWWNYTSDVSIFIPFVGYVQLTPAEVFNRYITVSLAVDFETGAGTYYINSSERREDTLEFKSVIRVINASIGMPISLTATNHQEQLKNLLQLGASTALGAVTGGVGLAIAGSSAINYALNGTQPSIQRGTYSGGSWGANNTDGKCYLHIRRRIPVEDDLAFAAREGLPLNRNVLLTPLLGYTEVGKIELNLMPNATKSEIDETETLLKNGVVF